MKERHNYFAVCAPGFETALEREILMLPGVRASSRARGGVAFSGDLELVYLSNLQLRSAHRILLRIADFLAQSYPMLYGHIRRVNWELYLGFEASYKLSVSARRSRLRHHKNIADSVRAGMSDALEPLGLRPRLDENAALNFYVRLFQDRCTLSVDTSGPQLHKRGFKRDIGAAPLRETLAASILLRLDIEAHDLILDPMCGSGTLLLEAAQILTRTPPGLKRSFALEHLPSHKPSLWARLKRQAAQQAKPTETRLIGNDLAAQATAMTDRAFANADLSTHLQLFQKDVSALDFTALRGASTRPLVLSNLPYGSRLGSIQSAEQLTRTLATLLKSKATGWSYALIVKDAAWLADLHPDTVQTFKNGGLKVALVRGIVP